MNGGLDLSLLGCGFTIVDVCVGATVLVKADMHLSVSIDRYRAAGLMT